MTETERDNYRNQSKAENRTQSCFRGKTTTLCRTDSKSEREYVVFSTDFNFLNFVFAKTENEIELETYCLHFPICKNETNIADMEKLTNR